MGVKISGGINQQEIFGQIKDKKLAGYVSPDGVVALKQIVFDNKINFPYPGQADMLYIATDSKESYIWERDKYVRLESDVVSIQYGTTAEWNAQPSLISKLNTIYVYTDGCNYYDETGVLVEVPGIKIGSGAYLIDINFIGASFQQKLIDHITDTVAHITAEERAKWNNKLNYVDPAVDDDLLVFNRD